MDLPHYTKFNLCTSEVLNSMYYYNTFQKDRSCKKFKWNLYKIHRCISYNEESLSLNKDLEDMMVHL